MRLIGQRYTKRELLTNGRSKYIARTKWLFYLPGAISNTIFGWYPLLAGLIIGFQVYHIIKPATYAGLTNFQALVNDPTIFIAFRNTLYYCFLNIALVFFVPIIIAILLMEMKRSVIRIMMILWFIPVSSMAGMIIWKWFYNVDYGLFNGILINLGLPTLRWLSDLRLSMICLVLPGLIMYGPGLIYIASIQSIPDEFYEAAELEGAGLWRKVWSVTLPRLRPIIAMMLLLSIIGNMQVFDRPYVMTGGGPGMATVTVVMRFFAFAFQSLNFGKGAALALILFLVVMVMIILQRKYFKENIDV